MIFENRKKYIKHQYTIIELLVVLVIAGLLTGLTVGGIKGALARQGAAGAVRTLASEISMARSFAVSKNRYVALLMADEDDYNGDLKGSTKTTGSNNPIPNDNTDNFNNSFPFTKNRICFLKTPSGGNYEWDSWVQGYEWRSLPSKTIAFIVLKRVLHPTPSKTVIRKKLLK